MVDCRTSSVGGADEILLDHPDISALRHLFSPAKRVGPHRVLLRGTQAQVRLFPRIL
jgi:hypothetical protein